MHKKLLLLQLLLTLLIFSNCDLKTSGKEDCSAVSCEANFQNLYFEVLDSTGQNNLLEDSILTSGDIQIKGTPTVQFDVGTEFDKLLLIVRDTIWEIGTFNYELIFKHNDSLPVTMTLDRTGGNGCCSNRLFLEALEVDGVSKDVDIVPTLIQISVDWAEIPTNASFAQYDREHRCLFNLCGLEMVSSSHDHLL